MVQFRTLFALSAVFGAASAAPLKFQKRIAQVIAESTADWEQACLAAGGAQQCNPISQTAFSSLLAASGDCDQQDAADQMIDLAKELGGDAEMIRLAQIFVQQPKNTPEGTQTPYCQQPPQNPELNGLFRCQFEGSVGRAFSGDQTGNVPPGLAAVNPVGSCPASPDGPVPDGVQLNTLVQDPGNGNAGNAPAPQPPANNNNNNNNAGNGPAAGRPTPPAQQQPAADAPADNEVNDNAPANNAPAPPAAGNPNARPFTLANGQAAIALNEEFASLTPNSPCTAGQSACVQGGFAQCVNGQFAITQCAGNTQCFALPLVNSPGTSITCSTAAEAQARIAATGAA